MKQTLTNTEILCFVLGWQGGTLAQVSDTLRVTDTFILNADWEAMQMLCRRAQVIREHDVRGTNPWKE